MRLFSILLAALLLPGAALHAVQVRIDSPDKNSTWAGATPTRRELRWDEKHHILCATVIFDNALHADSSFSEAQDELTFTFPGTTFDPADNTIGVAGPDGARIAIGEWRKAVLGKRFLMYQNTLIMLHRNHSAVSLTLDVDTERKAEAVRKKQEETETENSNLDSLVHSKN